MDICYYVVFLHAHQSEVEYSDLGKYSTLQNKALGLGFLLSTSSDARRNWPIIKKDSATFVAASWIIAEESDEFHERKVP